MPRGARGRVLTPPPECARPRAQQCSTNRGLDYFVGGLLADMNVQEHRLQNLPRTWVTLFYPDWCGRR